MKKRKAEIMRMETMIYGERLSGSDKFMELLTRDSDILYKEYFDYKGYPNVTVNKVNGGYAVNVSFNAISVKPFRTVPDEGNGILE